MIVLIILALFIVFSSIRQVDEYERGIKFTFGKFSGLVSPGWHIVWPVV